MTDYKVVLEYPFFIFHQIKYIGNIGWQGMHKRYFLFHIRGKYTIFI